MEENNESPAPATATPTGPNRNRHFWLLRSIFLLLGVGVLVPWNAFISAKGYFQSRFCDPNDPDNTSTMESTFVFVYTLSSVLSLGMILLGQWAYGYFLQHRRTLVPSTNEEVDGLFLEDGERQDQSAINEGEIDHEVIQNEDEGALQMTPVDDEHVISVDEPSDPHLEHRPTKASSSSMWFDIIPLSLFLLVFCGQTILVLFVGISSPDSIALWTYLSLAICGVCSSLATAGIVAVAGQIQNADLAMNPFLAVSSCFLAKDDSLPSGLHMQTR